MKKNLTIICWLKKRTEERMNERKKLSIVKWHPNSISKEMSDVKRGWMEEMKIEINESSSSFLLYHIRYYTKGNGPLIWIFASPASESFSLTFRFPLSRRFGLYFLYPYYLLFHQNYTIDLCSGVKFSSTDTHTIHIEHRT